MGAVYAGWLTKSPEDRKGLFSLFSARQKWKRRYFVLYCAPTSGTEDNTSSPSPVLVYYVDEAMKTQKGTIDLGNCEEIVDHVESCYYRHLFLLKTVTPQGYRRTYYLAADSSDDVTNWVKKLHSTLNLYEDKLFTNTVLSITKSGSEVTGIIATVNNLEVNSETSKTNANKTPINESLTLVNPDKSALKQLSHVQWLIVNSETKANCLELLSNNAGLCDSNSGTPVSKCGRKVKNPKLDQPFKANVSAEATSTGSLSVDASSTLESISSSAAPGQSGSLQNETLSGKACTGQTGAKYCRDWPQFVKELLDDGNEHQGMEKEEGQEGKVEGKSVFYVCNMSSFSPDKNASPNDTQKGQRPNLSQSNDEAPAFPSTQSSSSDVTCYVRITKGSRRYKSIKKRPQNINLQMRLDALVQAMMPPSMRREGHDA